MEKKDTIFTKKDSPSVFRFDQQVADVFDEMIERSVPFYQEIQRMTAELTQSFAQKETSIYDLGCSTGTTLSHLSQTLQDKDVTFIGVDNSKNMLEKAKLRLQNANVLECCQLNIADLNEPLVIENASVVLMILTMQFVKRKYRARLVKQIYQGLNKGGALIVIEKIIASTEEINERFVHFYYNFKKRNGYSELEIAKKREALENVLEPLRLEDNVSLLKENGFKSVDIFFNWYNFLGMIAVK